MIVHWAYLWNRRGMLPDLGEASQLAAKALLPQLVLSLLLLEIKRLRNLAHQHGNEIALLLLITIALTSRFTKLHICQ